MNMTEKTRCTFSVSENNGKDPWIMIEVDEPGISSLNNGFLGLELYEDVSFQEAEKLAELLRNKIVRINYTSLR